MQTLPELQDNLLSEIKSLSKEIASSGSAISVVMNYSKIVTLFEKASFLKAITEKKISTQQLDTILAEQVSALQSCSNAQEKVEEQKEEITQTQKEQGSFIEKEEQENKKLLEEFVQEKNPMEQNQTDSIEQTQDSHENQHPPKHHFKLASIKSSKNLEKEKEEQADGYSFFKMDERNKQEFLEFLFDNNQQAMDNIIKAIYQAQDLQEAKIFLSDLYYKNNWSKSEEFAQALWRKIEKRLS